MKKRVIAAILGVLNGLRTTAGVQKVERRRSIAVAQRVVSKSIILVVGDESVIGQDTRGYTLEFPINVKLEERCTVDQAWDRMEDFQVAVEDALEADITLGGVINALRYEGEVDLTGDAESTNYQRVLAYVVQYRRVRGSATTGY
jgi:hypothetical protein